jgi:hypothetical protein
VRLDSPHSGAATLALLVRGRFANQNYAVPSPAPDLWTFEGVANGADPERPAIERHTYRKIGVEPNIGGRPLAIYQDAPELGPPER